MLEFLTYTGAVITAHFTGLIHRGAPLVGVEVRLYPVKDRAVGVLLGSRFIGWAYAPSRRGEVPCGRQ